MVYFAYLFVVIALSILAGFIISKHIVSHLERLTTYISSLTKNKFRQQHEAIDLKNSASEITEIYREFQQSAGSDTLLGKAARYRIEKRGRQQKTLSGACRYASPEHF